MTDQSPTSFVMVASDAIEKLTNEIRDLRAEIQGATITPRDEWVSISEAARMMGCSTSTIRRRIDSGELQAKGRDKLRRVRLV